VDAGPFAPVLAAVGGLGEEDVPLVGGAAVVVDDVDVAGHRVDGGLGKGVCAETPAAGVRQPQVAIYALGLQPDYPHKVPEGDALVSRLPHPDLEMAAASELLPKEIDGVVGSYDRKGALSAEGHESAPVGSPGQAIVGRAREERAVVVHVRGGVSPA